jgi:hypothetical protein
MVLLLLLAQLLLFIFIAALLLFHWRVLGCSVRMTQELRIG